MNQDLNPASPVRSINVDIIRVIAMLMIVVLHTWLNFTLRPDFFGTKVWFSLIPATAISKTGVLLFFMLSGYLVINKQRSIKENLLKIKDRLFFPLVFFSALTIGYEWFRFQNTGLGPEVFLQAQLTRVTDFPSSPLWFLGVLIIFYLLNPLWQKVFNPKEKPDTALYLTGLAFIFSIIATIIKFPVFKVDFFFNSFTGWLGYLSFYFYGGLIKNHWIYIKKQWLNWLLVLMGLLTIAGGDYYTSSITSKGLEAVWANYTVQFLSLPVILTSVGLFNILITADFSLFNTHQGNKARTFIELIASLSFGVYLTHTFVISVLYDFAGFDFNRLGINVYLYNLINYLLVLGISLIITYLIKKTPKLRAIIGE